MTTTTNLALTKPTVGGDSDTWGDLLNADLDLLDGFAASLTCGAEIDVPSAPTCDIGAAANTTVRITGTAAISSFGTEANKIRFVRFAGALLLNHNSTSLALLGGVNHKTAANDVGIYKSDDAGNWRELAFFPALNDPSAASGQKRRQEKTGITSGTTFFQTPVVNNGVRGSIKICISAMADGPAPTIGYCGEYSEHVLDYDSYGGSFHTPTVTVLHAVQNSISSASAAVSMTVTGSISGGTISIIITPSFTGASPATSVRINAVAEALGPDMTSLISAV